MCVREEIKVVMWKNRFSSSDADKLKKKETLLYFIFFINLYNISRISYLRIVIIYYY